MINNNIKDSKYYYELLRKDTVILLILSILCSLLVFTGSEEVVPLFIESIIFVIFESIILFNKEESKQIGTFCLVLSIIIIVLSIIMLLSYVLIFNIIYLILGFFYFIHTTRFTKSYNQEEHNSNITNQNRTKKTNSIKYISLIPILFSFILLIISAYNDIFNDVLKAIVSLTNLFNAIFCIMYNKNKKYILLYINTVISIFISLAALILMLS